MSANFFYASYLKAAPVVVRRSIATIRGMARSPTAIAPQPARSTKIDVVTIVTLTLLVALTRRQLIALNRGPCHAHVDEMASPPASATCPMRPGRALSLLRSRNGHTDCSFSLLDQIFKVEQPRTFGQGAARRKVACAAAAAAQVAQSEDIGARRLQRVHAEGRHA